MARHPSFFALGALAGLALWTTDAPTPFPLLGMIALVCGVLGFALSIAYIASFEPWRLRDAAGSRRGREIDGRADRVTRPEPRQEPALGVTAARAPW